jgi:hypothetical protein
MATCLPGQRRLAPVRIDSDMAAATVSRARPQSEFRPRSLLFEHFKEVEMVQREAARATGLFAARAGSFSNCLALFLPVPSGQCRLPGTPPPLVRGEGSGARTATFAPAEPAERRRVRILVAPRFRAGIPAYTLHTAILCLSGATPAPAHAPLCSISLTFTVRPPCSTPVWSAMATTAERPRQRTGQRLSRDAIAPSRACTAESTRRSELRSAASVCLSGQATVRPLLIQTTR